MNRCSGINFCGVYIKESCLFEVVSAVFSIHLGIFITVQYYAYKLHLEVSHAVNKANVLLRSQQC